MKAFSLLILLTIPLFSQIPAFPGAEGFGAHANGGRGGDVYVVTNLNQDGAGSLKYGVDNAPSSGRTIVFAVSGYINIRNGRLRVVRNNITIAGQTAPGDGIGLYDGTMRITGDNCIVRNLRLRHGKGGAGGDCLNVDSSAHDSIIDHVSMQFSTDENISFFNSSLDNFTMQRSLSAWGLESHNAGGLWDLEDGSCIDSLWAHHHTRNPKARPYGLLEWVNNVTFDWGIGFIMGDSQTPAPWKANVIGSYFLSPPSYTDNYALEKATVDRHGNPNFSLYLDDCLHDADGDNLIDGTDKGYAIVRGSEFSPGDPSGANRYLKSATPFPGASGNIAVSVTDPKTAFKKVISDAGAVRLSANYSGPLRDEVDTILFNNVVNQVHSRISRESDLPVANNGFGTLTSTAPPIDTDLDGMPDYWERALGFSTITQNHNTVFGSTAGTFFPAGTPTGYTHLEEYLHFKSLPHATMEKNTAGQTSTFTVDLSRYTSGFTASPNFVISNLSNGTVQKSGSSVTFTPTVNYSGRAGFDFTVTDSEGSSWTRRFAILVTVNTQPRDIIWKGGGGNAWNTSTQNWETNAGSPTAFSDGDNTLFDDQGNAASPVTLAANRSANSLTVTGSKNYTFSGAGDLSVIETFTKSSDTTLTLNTTVTTGGGTFLNGGETIINDGANILGGDLKFTGGSTFTDNTPSYYTLSPNLIVDEGAVGNINLSNRIDIDGSFSGGGTFNIDSPSTLGFEGRAYLRGTSAGCTGFVNLSGGATSPGNGGRIVFSDNPGDFNGFPNARLNLAGIDLFNGNNSGGNTYGIGTLSGDSSSRLRGAYLGGTTTWQVGSLNEDSEFAGLILDGTSGITALDKNGTGTLTLSGNNSYTGSTAIHDGELRVTGSLGNTDNFVGAGATLSGSGQVARLLTAQDDSTISPGDIPGEAGTMTTTNGFELKGATMEFDLSSNPSSGNDRILNSNGTLTFRNTGFGPAHFDFNLIDGSLSQGTYTLVSGGSGTSAPGSPSFTHNLPTNTRQNFSLQRSGGGSVTPGYIRLQVSGTSSDLTWTGSTSIWNLNNTTPWSGGAGGDNKFYNLDRAHFTDTAGNKNIILSGSFEPQSVTVSANTGTYNLLGSGTLTGNTQLIKSGNGTLQLSGSTAHGYDGGTLISGGTIQLANSTVGLGTGDITLSGGTLALPSSATFLDNSILVTGDSAISSSYGGNSTIADAFDATFSSLGSPLVDLSGVAGIISLKGSMSDFSGTLDFGGSSGMLRLNSGSLASQDVNFGSPQCHFDLGDAGATLTNRNGDKTIDLGALSGGSGTHLNGRQSGSGNTATTYKIGHLNLDTCFDGTISNGGDLGGLNLVKVGTGSLCLGGTSSITGSLNIESGTLATPGSLTLSGVSEVASGATLDLDGGTLATDTLTIATGGTLTGPGTIDGDLTNNGTIHCATGNLSITGSVVNDGTIVISGNANLTANGEFTNNGLFDMLTASGPLPRNLINNGIVIDASGLDLTSSGFVGNDFQLEIQTYSVYRYQLQWSSTMEPDDWHNVGTSKPGNNAVQTFTHFDALSEGPRFYRIRIEP